MDFTQVFNSLNAKADRLEAAMKIIPHKNTLYSDKLDTLDENTKEIKNLEISVKKAINHHAAEVKDDYQEVKEVLRNVTDKLLFLLSEVEKAAPSKESLNFDNHNVLSEIKSPAPKLFDRIGASAAFSSLNTPRMSIDQYAKSPFTKKKNSTKVQLKFSDFDAEITQEQFEKIPSYIRGRLLLSDLQNFLEHVVVKCFNAKYELFYKNRAILKPTEFNLQMCYKEQSSLFDVKFISQGDLSRIKILDKKDEKYLQCLRNLQIIKEERKNSSTFYLWIEK